MRVKQLVIVASALAISFMLAGPENLWAGQKNVSLKVPKASCASNIPPVTFAAMSVEGVSDVDVDIDTKTVTLVFDDEKTTIDAIKNAFSKADYPVEGEPVFNKK